MQVIAKNSSGSRITLVTSDLYKYCHTWVWQWVLTLMLA